MGLSTQQFPSENKIKAYQEFWNWFSEHAEEFFDVIKSGEDIQDDFISRFAPKLNEVEPEIFFLVGMETADKAQLTFTPDGRIQQVYWAEKLVEMAPRLANWEFQALKGATSNIDFALKIHDLTFDRSNIYFYPINHTNYPDKIDLMFVYDSYHEEAHEDICNGIFIYLENFLGEETMIECIDRINVTGAQNIDEELISIDKLKDYIIWREKEFVEKYQDIRHDSSSDEFTGFEGTVDGDKPIISTFNTTILNWDNKASHPWILVFMIEYDAIGNAGFPSNEDYEWISKFEEDIEKELPGLEGYIFLGSETVDGIRETFIACREYRLATAVASKLRDKYIDKLNLSFEFYKDKYWQSFERYMID